MSITAVVTNHNYAQYLSECIDSAIMFCDEVLVYDDGSTDNSMEVLAQYGDKIKVTHRDKASGSPVWGSNLGIKEATSTHLIFLDADNRLVSFPQATDADYTFATIDVIGDKPRKWCAESWPTNADACWEKLRDNAANNTRPLMPFPWGGVWKTEFLKDKKWRPFKTTGYAPDLRTAMDWCKARPTLAYSDVSFMQFRKHEGQMSGPSEERPKMLAELDKALRTESMPKKGIDIVYVCRSGPNEELRYSLRSLENLPHGRVWVFGGDLPEWVTNVIHVPVKQTGSKWKVSSRAIKAACEHPGVSDPFILMNDDFFVTEQVKDVPPLHLGSAIEVASGYETRNGGVPSRYTEDMRATHDMLVSMGFDEPLSYDAHVPLKVYKSYMLDALDLYYAAGLLGTHKRTVYGNIAGLGGTEIDDVKVWQSGQKARRGPWLSSLDTIFHEIIPVLDYLFPDRCQYESEPKSKPKPLRYPVRIRTGISHEGKRYPRGSLIDRQTAIMLKIAGKLSDERIV